MCGSSQLTTSVCREDGESTGITLLDYVSLADGNLLHMLQPERATYLIFTWLEIVAHRELVDQTLGASRKDGVSHTLRAAYRAVYAQLLVDRLKFLSFFLHSAQIPEPIAVLCTAIFRLCLILVYKYPEPIAAVYTAIFPLCLVLYYKFPDFLTEYLLSELVTVLRITGYLLTFLINLPGLYTLALAAATATTEATRGEHDGSEAVSQEAPPPPQGRKAGGQQANAAMLWSARATQHLPTFGLAANLQYNVELIMNVVQYICITAVKRLRVVK
uniref:Not1 domain-containing protein n=1 Tax=Mesocestoides corti TaxID=53468 RepID=A0A5K3G577_MESCO